MTALPRASRVYDWDAHHRTLTGHPNEWHMLEADTSGGIASLIRDGKQPVLAPLLGHLDIRMRHTYIDGKTRKGELWARYTPDTVVPTKRNQPATGRRTGLSDEDVAAIRTQAADLDTTTSEVCEAWNISPSYLRYLVRGTYRRDAGGPIRGEDY